MGIEVTYVKVYKVKNRGALKGYANIVLNDSFMIKGIKIIESNDKRFVGMPSRKVNKGKISYRDICNPINRESRQIITDAILEKYDN